MSLTNYVRFQTLLQVYIVRYPDMVEASKIFCLTLENFKPMENFGLARHYVGFITRYRKCWFNFSLSQAEWSLLDEVLIDLELEIVLALAEAKAFHNHNQN